MSTCGSPLADQDSLLRQKGGKPLRHAQHSMLHVYVQVVSEGRAICFVTVMSE